MKQRFVIHGKLPSLNDVTAANRTNPHAGAKQKRRVEEDIAWAIAAFRLKPMSGPVAIHCDWYEANHRRDCDNVVSSIKFVQDALVRAGKLPGDGQRVIPQPPTHRVFVDKLHPRVEVTIETIGES